MSPVSPSSEDDQHEETKEQRNNAPKKERKKLLVPTDFQGDSFEESSEGEPSPKLQSKNTSGDNKVEMESPMDEEDFIRKQIIEMSADEDASPSDEENLARRSCMNTNDLIVTLPENACTLKRCNLPFTCSLSKYHNNTKVAGNIAEVMPSVYLKCETSQMVNVLHLYSAFIDLMATKGLYINPFTHTFIQRRRCQPCKAPSSSSGESGVRCLAHGHLDTWPGIDTIDQLYQT